MHKRMSLSAIESDNKMAALLLATSIYPIKFIIIIKSTIQALIDPFNSIIIQTGNILRDL